MAQRKLNALEMAQQAFQRLSQGAGQAVGNFAKGVQQQYTAPLQSSFSKPLYNAPQNQLIQNAANAVGKVNIARLSPLGNVFPQIRNAFPTVGDYTQNQIVKPLSLITNQKASPIDRGLGALQGGFSATPAGSIYNVGSGIAAGALRSVRTGMALDKSIKQAVTNPTSVATQGLGVKNPFLAMGLDVLAGNPKGAIKGLKSTKGIASALKGVNPKAFAMHPEDIQDAKSAIDILRYTKGGKPEDKAYALKTVQNILDHYIPGHKYSNTKKALDAIENIIQTNEQVPNGLRTKFPSMGLVGKSDVAQPPLYDTGTYYIRNGANELVKAENAKPINLGNNVEAFSHRFGKDTGVVISEAKTGMQIATGKTEKEAIANAQKAFKDLRGITPQQLIERQLRSLESGIIKGTDGGIGKRNVGGLNTGQEAIPYKETNRFGSRPTMQGANPSSVTNSRLSQLVRVGESNPKLTSVPSSEMSPDLLSQKIIPQSSQPPLSDIKTLYRGGATYDASRGGKYGISLTTSPDRANFFTKQIGPETGQRTVQQFSLSPDAKIATVADVPAKFKGDMVDNLDLIKYLKDKGFDGFDMRGVKGSIANADQEVRVFNNKVISQSSPSQPPVTDIAPGELKRVSDNLIKNNPGMGRKDAEAMARDVIRNRPFNGSENFAKGSISTKVPTSSVKVPPLPEGSAGAKAGQSLLKGQPPQGSGSNPLVVGSKNVDVPYFNTKNYNIPGQAKEKISQTVEEIKPQIEKTVGSTLTNKEAIEFANNTSKVLHKVVPREQTLEWEASLIKARQALADSAKSGKIDQSYIDNLLTIKSQGTDIARKLQSFSISADPITASYKDKILEAVLKTTDDTDKVLAAAQGVDFNDANQAANFYRQFIKPTLGEKIDLIRYNSMLSSPLTHITNLASNAINTGIVTPIEKSVTGAIDFLNPIRIAKGKPQTQFPSEGAAYLKGYYSKLGEASRKFADVLSGKIPATNLDIKDIPLATTGKAGQVVFRLSIPTKLLEASDQFFTSLAKGGEEAALGLRKGKGVNVGNIETEAARKAAYRLFRGELHEKNQGPVLNAVDDLTAMIQRLRGSKNPVTSTVAKFTIPFLKTPMNIVKQGIEYSPAGFATIPGAANKTEQLSKAVMGSTGAAMAALMITSGRTTWAEPTDPTNRARFRAAGLQPYSVKIGDKWVSYQKLPPAMSFPLAFMSAIHDAQSKKTIDQSQADAIMSAMSKFGNFYSDQSYLKNIGDAISATKGSPEDAVRFIGNYPQQLIPFRALLGWMSRLTDPLQRKTNTDAGYLEQQVQNLLKEIPLASRMVPARMDENGQPIPNQDKEINAFSPFKMSNERPNELQFYKAKQKESLINKNMKAAEQMMQEGKKVDFGDVAGAAESSSQTNDLQSQVKDKITVKQVKLTGKPIEQDGKIYYPKGNSVRTIDLNSKLTEPEFTGNTELDKKAFSKYQSEITKKTNEIVDLKDLGKITPDQAETLISGLKQKLADVKEKQTPNKFADFKLTGNNVIDKELITKQISLYSTEINNIVKYVNDGKLTPEQGANLITRIKAKQKEIKYGKGTGGGRKAKKINYKGIRTTAKAIKIPTLKYKTPKTRIPKYKPVKRLKVKYR